MTTSAPVEMVRLDGERVGVDGGAVDAFAAGLRGSLLRGGDPGYDEAREIWNAMIDRRPGLIARCAGVADVVRSVGFAREHGLLTAVHGGGHNIAGNAVCDGGLNIDLSPMRSVRVDPAQRRAYVEPGATLGDFDHECQAFGLATPVGINSTTGLAGLTLGGGFGWLTRKHGMTVDNLVSADVVTADGRLVRASADEHSDLFWAIRGGGGNFGVVTMFEFQLHPVGPDVFSGLIVFPLEEARTVLAGYAQLAPTMPDELSVWVVLRQAPPLPFLPESVHGKGIVAMACFWGGDPAGGPGAVEAVRGLGHPVGEHLGVQPYVAWQQAFDPLLTPGARNYWKSHNFLRLDDGALDALVQYAARLPSPDCEIFIGQVGGAASRVSPDATAYCHRDALYVMNVHGRWASPEDDGPCIAWAREFFEAARPYASGSVYVNFLTADEGDRVGAAYGPLYQRLVRVKDAYDPDNLFRVNQNIRPTTGSQGR